ncbi:phosphoribosylamine--glycine ligase [Haloarchaeobius sp. TZWSO28]|uniref:phosphoribosylamine--glycine ligase n=1 Tax=Haloarchaeobius sp. TZWSO28 TaxID=3446119 RepID=UPI003EB70703
MDRRNFLFVSIDGLIGDVAWRVREQGHDVRYYIESESEREIADGFVEKTDDWEADVAWADVIVFDDVFGHGTHAERLREEGHAVVGGTEYTDRLEEDKGFGQEELADHGVNILPRRRFTDFDEAVSFVQDNPARYVIKPSGEVQNVKRLVYVGEDDDGGDVVDVLRAYKRAWGHRMQSFELQRRAEGVEVAIGAFFNGNEFVEPVNVNFEHKKLFPGNVGPPTGEMGTSMFWTEPTSLFERTLRPIEETLAEEGYVGYIDLNCIVNGRGIYPLEFTPRFGYPGIFIQEEGMKTPISQLFADIANGNDPGLEVHRGFQVGVRVCLPPFPFNDDATFDENSKNAAIVFREAFEGERPPGVHIEDAKRVGPDGTAEGVTPANGQWRVSGSSGIPLVVTGKGTSMRAAQKQAYDRIEDIILPNMYYRDDIGDRWVNDGDKLLSWGYLR